MHQQFSNTTMLLHINGNSTTIEQCSILVHQTTLSESTLIFALTHAILVHPTGVGVVVDRLVGLGRYHHGRLDLCRMGLLLHLQWERETKKNNQSSTRYVLSKFEQANEIPTV